MQKIINWNIVHMPAERVTRGRPFDPRRDRVIPGGDFFIGDIQAEEGQVIDNFSVRYDEVRATTGETTTGKVFDNHVDIYQVKSCRATTYTGWSTFELGDPHPDYAATHPNPRNEFLDSLLRRGGGWSEAYIKNLPRNRIANPEFQKSAGSMTARFCGLGRALGRFFSRLGNPRP